MLMRRMKHFGRILSRFVSIDWAFRGRSYGWLEDWSEKILRLSFSSWWLLRCGAMLRG